MTRQKHLAKERAVKKKLCLRQLRNRIPPMADLLESVVAWEVPRQFEQVLLQNSVFFLALKRI